MTSTEHPVAPAVVRVLDAAGDTVGAGFVIGDGRLATCAHVVTAAVGGDPGADTGPIGQVTVDFPLIGGQRHTAWVQQWWPIQPDGTGDVAVLRLEAPVDGARMPPLYRSERPWGHRFRVIGFPTGMHDGVWAAGELRAEQGTRWVQLQGDPQTQQIVQGFSGAPVWDDELHAVVGMTVAADVNPATTTAYLIPIHDVIGVDPSLLPNPYRGLEPFDERHAEYFCGRDDDIARLAAALRRERLVAIVGRSGTGKSSLLRAGLLPRLRAEGARIAEVRTTSAASPDAVVADAVRAAGGTDVVLVADQFEELVGSAPDAGRALLGELIAQTVDGSARVVLTLRWEAMNELLTESTTGVLEAGTMSVAPMGRSQLREAIVGPSLRAPGLFFEDGLVERILDDAGEEPGQLPLVESLLTQLWAARRGGMLTIASYHELGGVHGAVTRQAENAMASLGGAVPDDRVRRVLTMLAAPVGGPEFVRRPARFEDLDPEQRQVTDALTRGRLLVIGREPDGTHSVELAHQALIDHWPRLREWLSEDRDFLAWQQELDTQATAWRAAERDHGALLRGSGLATAREWLETRSDRIPQPHREYIAASRSRQRREVRRWRVVAAALLALVLAAGVLTAVTVQNNREISANLRKANAQLLADQAGAQAPLDTVRATQLALAAYRADPTNADVRTALAKQFLTNISVDNVFSNVAPEPIERVQSSSDSSSLLLRHGEGATVVTGADRAEPDTVPLSADGISDFHLSPDGRWVIGTGTGGARRWDLRRPGKSTPLAPDARVDPKVRPAFSSDSARFAFAATDNELHVHEVESGAPVTHQVAPPTKLELTEVWLNDAGLVLLAHKRELLRKGERFSEERAGVVVHDLDTGKKVRSYAPSFTSTFLVVEYGISIMSCHVPDTRRIVTDPEPVDGVEVIDARSGKRTPWRNPKSDLGNEYGCSGLGGIEVVADGKHIMRPITDVQTTAAGAFDRRTLHPLSDEKVAIDVLTPRLPEKVSDHVGNPLRRSGRIAVSERDGQHQVVVPHGRSVLRIDADLPIEFASDNSNTARRVPGGRHLLMIDGTNALHTYDPDTGARIASTREGQVGDSGLSTGLTVEPSGKTLSVIGEWSDDRASIRRLSIPDLKSMGEFRPPLPDKRADGPATERDLSWEVVGDRLAAVHEGLLSVFELRTQKMLGKPVQITGDRPAAYQENWLILARPGHPNEVLVVSSDGPARLWNIDTRRPAGAVFDVGTPNRALSGAVSPDGDRYYALDDADGEIDIWDLNTGERVGEPRPVGLSTYEVLGFNTRGELLTDEQGEQGWVVSFWSPEVQPLGSLPLRGSSDNEVSGVSMPDPARLAAGQNGKVALDVPTTPDAWFEHLCDIQDRVFTAAELKKLPPGVDTERPCSRE